VRALQRAKRYAVGQRNGAKVGFNRLDGTDDCDYRTSDGMTIAEEVAFLLRHSARTGESAASLLIARRKQGIVLERHPPLATGKPEESSLADLVAEFGDNTRSAAVPLDTPERIADDSRNDSGVTGRGSDYTPVPTNDIPW